MKNTARSEGKERREKPVSRGGKSEAIPQKTRLAESKKLDQSGKELTSQLGNRLDEGLNYDKFDRYFSAVDIFQNSANKKGKSWKGRTKETVPKIPLLKNTISRNERRKCSYLEQYKKKCSRKLKTAMRKTDMKDGSRTGESAASDQCSISSKPSESELSIGSYENSEELRLGGRMISNQTANGRNFDPHNPQVNFEEEKAYIDSIQRFERQSPLCVNFLIKYVNQRNVEKAPLLTASERQKAASYAGSTGKASDKSKKTSGQSLQKLSKKDKQKETSVEVLYMKPPHVKMSDSDHLPSRILFQPQRMNTPRTLVKSTSAKRPTTKSFQQRTTSVQSPDLHSITESCEKLKTLGNPEKTNVQGFLNPQNKTGPLWRETPLGHRTELIQKTPLDCKNLLGPKNPSGDRQNYKESKSYGQREISDDVQKPVNNDVPKQKPTEVLRSPSMTQNVDDTLDEDKTISVTLISSQSEAALGETSAQQELPKTCTDPANPRSVIPKWTSRGKKSYLGMYLAKKSYLEMYEAKKSAVVSVAMPRTVLPPVPRTRSEAKSAGKKIFERSFSKSEPLEKPRSARLMKTDTGRPPTQQKKRYFLKKKPTPAPTIQEDAEDIRKLQLLEEKKQMLQKQLRCIKSRSTNKDG